MGTPSRRLLCRPVKVVNGVLCLLCNHIGIGMTLESDPVRQHRNIVWL